MKTELQRIAIAEFCGWFIAPKEWLFNGEPQPEGVDTWIRPIHKAATEMPKGTALGALPPNYLLDLNAMSEAEKALPAMKWLKFMSYLKRVVWGTPITMSCTTRLLWEASAAQRAEALVRAIGKWVEA